MPLRDLKLFLLFSPKIPTYIKYNHKSKDNPNPCRTHLKDDKTPNKEKEKSKNDINKQVFASHFDSCFNKIDQSIPILRIIL